ncbi:MAG: NUDIX hydrolase [Actinomycetes bacterium]
MSDPVVVDRMAAQPVSDQVVRYEGMKWDVVTETVVLDQGHAVRRDVIVHPGAVGVVAIDDQDRVLLIQQYRHPVGGWLWELPAGLLDVATEDPRLAAERELAEEAFVRASEWSTLVDLFSSPGMSSEAYRVFLARGITEVPTHERHERTDEEKDMPVVWVPLDEACARVASGQVHNAMAVAGLLAARYALELAGVPLRPADSPWPERSDRYHQRS